MKILAVLPALLVSLSLYTTVANAGDAKSASKAAPKAAKCEGKTCKLDNCTSSAETCTHEGCDCPKCGHAPKQAPKTSELQMEIDETLSSGTTTAAPATKTTSTTATTETTAPATTGNGYTVTMAEGEMHCGDCAKKVSEALKALPEVEKGSVKVILASKTATLQVKPGAKVTADQIKKAIETKTGYTVSSVEPTTKMN